MHYIQKKGRSMKKINSDKKFEHDCDKIINNNKKIEIKDIEK